jgi:hydroxymethylbilane synthase
MCSIKVAARDSLLSQRQVAEVLKEMRSFFPQVVFDVLLLKTMGDVDQTRSLITLDKTDFFTREIDEVVLQGTCDVGIHSAKDLPDPMAHGLEVYAITQGVDPSDSLVLRDQATMASLRPYARIGISSLRRMEAVKALREDFIPVDIRGTIQTRLKLLEDRQIEALILAEAAIIRLGLHHLNRVMLQGKSAPMQGRLAIVGRKNHGMFQNLFSKLHYEIT